MSSKISAMPRVLQNGSKNCSKLQAGLTDFDILALFGHAATAVLHWSLDAGCAEPHTAAPC